MSQMDLISLWTQISAALQTFFQSTDNVIKTATGVVVSLTVLVTASQQLWTRLKKKRGRAGTQRSAAPAKSSKSRTQSPKPVRAMSAPTSVKASTANPTPAPPPRSATVIEPQRYQTHRTDATTMTPLQRPSAPSHLEPAGSPPSSQPHLAGPDASATAATLPVAAPTPPPRPKRVVHVVSILTFPWQHDHPVRKPVSTALAAASALVAIAYNLEDVSHQRTRSLRLYAKQLTFLLALVEALRGIHRHVDALDKALDDLRLPIIGDDPRAIMLSYLDPFASHQTVRSPDDMRIVFQAQAERIATLIEDNIGPIVERKRQQVGTYEYTSYHLSPPADG